MNIAVLIYGRLTNGIKHYDNIIDNIGKQHNIDFFLSSDDSNLDQLQEFNNVYKPKSYINDKIYYACNLSKYQGIREETNIHNMTCHFINKGRVFTLLEKYIELSNINYDVIISLRIDTIFNSELIFDNINDNTIYIPENFDFGGINDQVAYGNLSVMKKYMNIFNNCEIILEKGTTIPHPESLTLANINFYNLDICRVDLKHTIDKY